MLSLNPTSENRRNNTGKKSKIILGHIGKRTTKKRKKVWIKKRKSSGPFLDLRALDGTKMANGFFKKFILRGLLTANILRLKNIRETTFPFFNFRLIFLFFFFFRCLSACEANTHMQYKRSMDAIQTELTLLLSPFFVHFSRESLPLDRYKSFGKLYLIEKIL